MSLRPRIAGALAPLVGAMLVAAFAGPRACAQACAPFKVLVFWKTAGYVHGAQITAGISLIQSLGAANGFLVDDTADSSRFNPANLAQYAVVVFLDTSGDVLSPAEEAAFESYSTNGGGFVGIHSASDTEYGWPFYGNLLGTWFLHHPPSQPAALAVVDPNHPSTSSLPASFNHDDEWYNFQANVASNPAVRVLVTVDESTYSGGSMGPVHPISWCQEQASRGRSWYTGLGHTLPTYSAPFFQSHVLGGILWASGSIRQTKLCGFQAFGSASGSPPLSLTGNLSSTTATISLSGGTHLGAGLLCMSTCPASLQVGPLTILIELAPPALIGVFAVGFDASGHWQTALPTPMGLPGSVGKSLFVQGVEIGATLGLSNGLRIQLCR